MLSQKHKAPHVTFRRLSITELNEFVEICRITYDETYNIDPNNPEFSNNDLNVTLFGDKYIEKLREDLNSPHVEYTLAIINGVIAGYAKLIYEDDGKGKVQLDKLYFLKKHHGCGYGKKLLTQCAEQVKAKDRNSVYLYVNTKNEKAIAFYQKIGGVITGETMLLFCGHYNRNFIMVVDIVILLKNCRCIQESSALSEIKLQTSGKQN